LNQSGLAFMTPRFDKDVMHTDNQKILEKAAELALTEIQVCCSQVAKSTTYPNSAISAKEAGGNRRK
jgi:hypothetical protein